MFYKSSWLAVSVVLLSAGNVFALDTSKALDHKSVVVGDISVSKTTKNTGIDVVKGWFVEAGVGSVEMGAEKKNVVSSKLVGFEGDFAAEYSFVVDSSVVQVRLVVVKVPRAVVGVTKSLAVADDQQRSGFLMLSS